MTKKWLLWTGLVLFLGGIVSFIPNPVFGASSFFQFTMLSAVVSILVGGYFIYAAYDHNEKHNKLFKVWSVIFLVLAIVGFLFGFSLNAPDSWLCLIVGVAFTWLSEKTKTVI